VAGIVALDRSQESGECIRDYGLHNQSINIENEPSNVNDVQSPNSLVVMDVVIISTVLGAIALYPVYRLLRLLRRIKAVRRLERRFRYLVVWNTGITWLGAILISLYLFVNGFILVLLRNELERWAGIGAAINSIPLFLGGRRNIIIHYFGLNAHKLVHCVIGFAVIIEGLLHAALAFKRTQLRTSPWEYLVST